PHTSQQFRQRERLADVIVGSQVKTTDTVPLLTASGQNENRDSDVFLTCLPAYVETAHARQHEIEDDKIGALCLDLPEPVIASGCRQYRMPFHLEIHPEAAQNRRIIFHHQHQTHATSCKGSRRANVLPTPGQLFTVTRPWCACAICATTVSPSP